MLATARFALWTRGTISYFSSSAAKRQFIEHKLKKDLRNLSPIIGSRRSAFTPAGNIYLHPNKIGSREVVGFGINGKPEYFDSVVFPYPSIRFREITADFKALKEKEKGSWRMLTQTEKKCLYRISFCQTLSEASAPTGEWKVILGSVLITISASIWLFLLVQFFARPELPESFQPQNQVEQLKRMIDLRINPIDGISSKWDYNNNNWKGRPPRTLKKKELKKEEDEDEE